jgi:LCP family protein required for cell wall assembly
MRKSDRNQNRKKGKKRRKKRIIFLILEILLLLCLLACVYAVSKFGKMDMHAFEDGEIETNEGIAQDGYTTIALYGTDSREGELEEGTRTDTIMIAAINNKTKEVRIASVYRDTLLKQPEGTLGKINRAYAVGGPKSGINALNENLDLDISDYITVDFSALADVVDELGGLEIDVKEEEISEMNKYIKETAEVTGKEANTISAAGTQLLDGVQVVTYARIRHLSGGDYARTERQRLILQKLFEKVKGASLLTLNGIIDDVFSKVSTSISIKRMLVMAAQAGKYEIADSQGFPFELTDGKVADLGSVVTPLGLCENVQELHEFLYPGEEYVQSETVSEIAEQIRNLTGFGRDSVAY